MHANNTDLWPTVASQRNPANRVLSPFETWPPYIFYAPGAVYWIFLSLRYLSPTLPTLANSSFPGGGLLTEPKSVMLSGFGATGRSVLARYITFENDPEITAEVKADQAVSALEQANISFPVVAKPEVSRNGAGVKKRSPTRLR